MYINAAKANRDLITQHGYAPIGQPGQGLIKLAWWTCLAPEQFSRSGPGFYWGKWAGAQLDLDSDFDTGRWIERN